MSPDPLRCILSGHAAAALIGGIGWTVLGASPLAAALGAWIGGGVLTLGLAALLRRRASSVDEDEIGRSLTRWDAAMRADAMEAARRRAAAEHGHGARGGKA